MTKRRLLAGRLLPGTLVAALGLPLQIHSQTPAPSGTVITIVGNGIDGFSGDGGSATNAMINQPEGLTVGPDGTLYFADYSNNCIRAVNPVTGIITTIAGNGTAGSTGNGGSATNAEIAGPIYLTVDRARNALYFTEFGTDWIRKVNLTNNLLTVYAGTGEVGSGFSGDGGPATDAELSLPLGVATDGSGRLAFSDSWNVRVRRVDPLTGIITTIAGNGDVDFYGDGGLATSAALNAPWSAAADAAGDIFFVDIRNFSTDQTNCVRRIDAGTQIITTVAGGGTVYPGTDVATNMNIGDNIGEGGGVAVNSAGTVLYVAGGINSTPGNGPGSPTQIYKVDLTTGELTPYAGTGEANFSGDGGPALDATFDEITGIALAPGGGLIISDLKNNRIRYIVPDSITLTNDSQQTAFYLPWVSALSGDVTISGNDNLDTIDLSSLVTVNGAVNMADNASSATIDLSSLVTVAGSIDMGQNASVSTINLNSLVTVNGSVDMSQNATVATIDLSSLVTVAGSIDMSQNASSSTIDLSSLVTVAGSVDMSENASSSTIDLSSLVAVNGTVSIDGNSSATNIDLCSLTNVVGDLTITSNAPDAQVDLCNLSSFGNDTNATTMSVDGDVSVTNGLTIETNATLAGDATVDGSVTNNGTISPGASPGHLGFTGDLVLHHSSKLMMQLGGFAPGEFDSIDALGNVALDGTLDVSLLDGFLPRMTNGASFTLLTAGSSLTGALANVDDGGTLTTSDGYARFTVRYAGENRLRLTDLAIVDTDNDGTPDWWEDRYGLDKTIAADAALDLDGDGASSLNEFLAGTVPTNSASVFRITAVQPEVGGFRVIWTTAGGRIYQVQTNGDLNAPFVDSSDLITAPGTGESTTNVVESSAGTNGQTRFYRVRLVP